MKACYCTHYTMIHIALGLLQFTFIHSSSSARVAVSLSIVPIIFSISMIRDFGSVGAIYTILVGMAVTLSHISSSSFKSGTRSYLSIAFILMLFKRGGCPSNLIRVRLSANTILPVPSTSDYFMIVFMNLHETHLFQNKRLALLIVLRTSFASSSFDFRNMSPFASMFHSASIPDSRCA